MSRVQLLFTTVSLASGMMLWASTVSADEVVGVQRLVALNYPWLGRVGGIEGAVEITFIVNAAGEAEHVRANSGPQPLADAATANLKGWRFNSCRALAGCPYSLKYRFELNGECWASENCPSEFQIDLPDRVTIRAKRIRAMVN